MKIIIIYPDLSFRGGERLFSDLAVELARKKHKVIFITGRKNINAKKISPAIKLVSPQTLNFLFKHNLFFILISPIYIYLQVILNIKKTNLIYSAESYVSMWPSVIAALVFNKKIIISVFELYGEKTSISLSKHPFKYIFQRINNLFLLKASYLTTINPFLAKFMREDINLKNVTFIPAGIDFGKLDIGSKTKIISKYKLKSKNIIIMPGVIHPLKKQDFALDIITEIKKELPNIKLIIIGGGTKEHIRNIKKIIKLKSLENNIIMTGYINDSELNDFYAIAKMTLMCGPIAGLTIIESIYKNVMPVYPASAKNALGPSEPFKLGQIIKKYDSKAFARFMIRYLQNPARYSNKLNKDREFVIKKFNIKSTADELLLLINR